MFYELINNFQKGSDGWFLILKVDFDMWLNFDKFQTGPHDV